MLQTVSQTVHFKKPSACPAVRLISVLFQVEAEASGHAMYGKAREEDRDLEEAAMNFFLQGKEV